jgi:DNA replication protein DnaC
VTDEQTARRPAPETGFRAPVRLGETAAQVVAGMPAHARALIERKAARPPVETVETAQDRAERLARRLQARRSLWAARLPRRFAHATLADLDATQDPDGKVSGWLDAADSGTLLLVGEPGTGKTHAAYAVGNAAVAAGWWALGWTAADLNDALRPGGDADAYADAAGCDLLVWDDLGRDRITEWTLEQTQRVLDARSREQRKTVVTTNLRSAALAEQYGNPILDRLVDGATVVQFKGATRRRQAW